MTIINTCRCGAFVVSNDQNSTTYVAALKILMKIRNTSTGSLLRHEYDGNNAATSTQMKYELTAKALASYCTHNRARLDIIILKPLSQKEMVQIFSSLTLVKLGR